MWKCEKKMERYCFCILNPVLSIFVFCKNYGYSVTISKYQIYNWQCNFFFGLYSEFPGLNWQLQNLPFAGWSKCGCLINTLLTHFSFDSCSRTCDRQLEDPFLHRYLESFCTGHAGWQSLQYHAFFYRIEIISSHSYIFHMFRDGPQFTWISL